MGQYDDLYDSLVKANEERKRTNFVYFMEKLELMLTQDLDEAYSSEDWKRYSTLVKNIKSGGGRVFRNDHGEHKLDLTQYSPL